MTNSSRILPRVSNKIRSIFRASNKSSFKDDPGVRLIIPTINSEKYIDIVLQYYKLYDIPILVCIDSKTTDRTRQVLARSACYKVIEIHNESSRVGEIIGEISLKAGTKWILRIDDDELPSRNMIEFVSDVITRNDADAYSFDRFQCTVSSDGKLLRTNLHSSHEHKQWRLYQHKAVKYITTGHTPGFDVQGLRLAEAPSEAAMIHLDWAVHSFDDRKSKIKRYDAHTAHHGSLWQSYYLPEENEKFESTLSRLYYPEFATVATRIADEIGSLGYVLKSAS